MLYRVSGALFFLFGSFYILGYLIGGDTPRTGESGFASGQYGGLITGAALFAAGLYLLINGRNRRA